MEIFREPIHYHSPLLNIKTWTFTTFDLEPSQPRWHYHPEVEFIVVLDGVHTMYTTAETYVLHPGDVVVFGSSQLHRGDRTPGKRLSYIVMHVNLGHYFDLAMMHYAKYFIEEVEPLERFNAEFSRNSRLRKEVGAIISHLHQEVTEKRKGYEVAVSMYIKQLLLALLRNDDEGRLSDHENINAGILYPVTTYVEQNLASRIDMTEVSRIAGMSYSYFSRYFKNHVGIPFTEYVNRKRIAKAEIMLAVGSLNVTEIAHEVGIGNMSHFYELFKRISGCTPRQFQEKLRKS